MIKRELKVNSKSLIIWIVIVTIILSLVFLMYPFISETENGLNINDIVQIMPENLLKAFNMDLVDLSTVNGFFKSEGLVILMLVYTIYAGQLGSSILLKEESDKTIEYLYSKPVSKNKIITSKIISSVFNIILFILIINLVIYLGLKISGENTNDIIMLNTSLILPSIVIFSLTLFISTFFRKLKHTSTISYALVFLSYFLYTFSNISEKTEVLSYFSFFTIADTRGQIATNSYNFNYIIVFITITTILLVLTYVNYNKKEYLN